MTVHGDAAVSGQGVVMETLNFSRLRGWLTENVYRHGSRYTPNELLERATGQGLSVEPYLNYLRTKYSDLYGLK